MGESASDDFSVTDERRLGAQIMRDVWRDPAFLDDPVLLQYTQSLWAPLVASARRLGHIGHDVDEAFAWEVFLVRDRSVNAFALPGGHVGVHLGLIAMTSTRDELASVLAHELSHVSQRHIARGIGANQRTSLVGVAAMIVAVLAASRAGNADAAQAAIVGGQAAMIQGQLNFSRDVEREADRIGYGMLLDADYAGSGMAAMFERLASANRLNDSGNFPYLRSHPLTTDRISEARARLSDPSAPAGATGDAALHAIMGARARVLMDPTVASLRRLQAPAAGGASAPERLAAFYGAALASSLLGELVQAQRAAEQALSLAGSGVQSPGVQQALRWLGIELALAAGDPVAASKLLAGPAAGNGRAEMILRAQVALAGARQGASMSDARLRDATEALQTWTAVHPIDATVWGLLAQCAEAAQMPLRSARAAAESRAAKGDLPGAIDLLRSTQRRAQSSGQFDLIEAQIIDARLRVWVAMRREELRERGLPLDRLRGE